MATGGGPVGPGGSRALHVEPSSGGSADLFGRERELGALAAALDEVAAGSGRVVGIVGEAGIGKTRLAAEAVALAAAQGFTVLTGRTPVPPACPPPICPYRTLARFGPPRPAQPAPSSAGPALGEK